MTQDARFEDGKEAPLRLMAAGVDDLNVVSALVQDAVVSVSEIGWKPASRQFALLLNRFRWEDLDAAQTAKRPYERVQSLLVFEDVLRVQTNGLDASDKEQIIAVLGCAFEAGEDGTGRIVMALSGEGEIGLDVECINVTLRDVTRPHAAHAKGLPDHRLDD